jgi:hypothetical protein
VSWKPFRTLTPRSALPALAVLLVLGAGAAAHANRPVPFGDQLSAPGKAEASPVSAESASPVTLAFKIGPGLEAYDPTTGAQLWSYRRDGATALHVSMLGPSSSPEQSAVVVWDDGMVTSLRVSDHQVRWHRSVPGLSDWLRGAGEPGDSQRTDIQRKELQEDRAASAVQTVLGPEPWVQVLTPELTMGFRDRDGDLRFNSRPQAGCLYDPTRAVSTDSAVLLPRACTGTTGSGRQLPGSVTGFKLASPGFVINTGPRVQLIPLDGHRVRLDDGPLVGPRVVDADTGIIEVPCGSSSAPFAAESAACPSPTPSQQPTH